MEAESDLATVTIVIAFIILIYVDTIVSISARIARITKSSAIKINDDRITKKARSHIIALEGRLHPPSADSVFK